MAKTRAQKEETLQQLTVGLSKAKGVVFATYMGLSVADLQQLRRDLRAENNELVVAKKTLIGRMLKDAGLSAEYITGSEGATAVVFGYTDEVSPAKVLATFAKKHEVVGFQAGILEGKLINAGQVTALSKIPSRQELLGRMVGSLKFPISGFVTVLGGNLRGLVQALNQVKEKKVGIAS